MKVYGSLIAKVPLILKSESQMLAEIQNVINEINVRSMRFGFFLTVSKEQSPLNQVSDFKRFRSLHIEEEDFSWLPQNPYRNKGKTLKIGNTEFIVPSKSGDSLIWAMGGKYEGKDAFDIPQSYIDSFPTWSTTILPGYVTDAMKRRKDFDNKEEWHEWFDSTYVPLGDTVADSVMGYLKETTVDFVIEISGEWF